MYLNAYNVVGIMCEDHIESSTLSLFITPLPGLVSSFSMYCNNLDRRQMARPCGFEYVSVVEIRVQQGFGLCGILVRGVQLVCNGLYLLQATPKIIG